LFFLVLDLMPGAILCGAQDVFQPAINRKNFGFAMISAGSGTPSCEPVAGMPHPVVGPPAAIRKIT